MSSPAAPISSPRSARWENASEHARRDVEAALGETLTEIARLSSVALAETDAPHRVEKILAIRRQAVEGLEDLQVARDGRARELLRTRTLIRGLRELTHRFQTQTRIFTELRLPTREPALSDDVAWALYAVADQALESLEVRSRATGVVLILNARNDEVSLSIRDDGVGLLARQGSSWRASPHAAIRAMRRSMESVGGMVSVTSARPRGLLLRAVAPLGVM